MFCPVCRLPLLTLEIEGIEVDYCADDMGVWFDEGEIEVLLERTTPVLTADRNDARGKRRCPRCDTRIRVLQELPECHRRISEVHTEVGDRRKAGGSESGGGCRCRCRGRAGRSSIPARSARRGQKERRLRNSAMLLRRQDQDPQRVSAAKQDPLPGVWSQAR